jgi:hypothetical protein
VVCRKSTEVVIAVGQLRSEYTSIDGRLVGNLGAGSAGIESATFKLLPDSHKNFGKFAALHQAWKHPRSIPGDFPIS